MTRLACVLALSLAACAAESAEPADSAAESAMPEGGKADGASYAGLYHISSSTLHANDVTDLELRADGTYVRGRCYHASCRSWIPETDHYDVVTTHGHSYVRFWSFRVASDGTQQPAIADVYEVRTISKGVQLRKTYTSRWFSLFASSVSSQCASTGGTFANDTCTCPNSTYSDSGYEAFAAGAGGCIFAPSGSEEACDSSGGFYTDDDSTAISTFCTCGIGRFVTDDGSCTSI